MPAFNDTVRWSNLSRLAGGNVPKLTIAAPFIAFIILHLEPLQPMLELSDSRHASPSVEFLARARFDIFYLGLVVVGLGVAIYALVVPPQVDRHDGYEAFIAAKEATKTPNGIAGSLALTLEHYLEGGPVDARPTRRYPRRFAEGLRRLLGQLSREGAAKDAVELTRLLGPEPEDPARAHALVDALGRHSTDVFRLEYLRADYAAPTARHAAFAILVLGTAIALLPTLVTTVLVLSDLSGIVGSV